MSIRDTIKHDRETMYLNSTPSSSLVLFSDHWCLHEVGTKRTLDTGRDEEARSASAPTALSFLAIRKSAACFVVSASLLRGAGVRGKPQQ